MIRMLRFHVRNFYRQSFGYIYLMMSLFMAAIVQAMKAGSQGILPKSSIIMITCLDVFTVASICLFSTFDSDSGTVKNIVSRGYDKVRLFFSKYIVAIGIAITCISLKILTVFIYSRFEPLSLENLWHSLGCSIICLIPEVLLYVILCMKVGKSKYSITVCVLVYVLVPAILTGISELLETGINLPNYWVSGLKFLDTVPQIIGILVYTALLIPIGIFVAKRKEIK